MERLAALRSGSASKGFGERTPLRYPSRTRYFGGVVS